MASPKRKRIDIRKMMRLTTALVLIGSAGLIAWAAYFMMSTLNAVSASSVDLGTQDVKIQTIDVAKLQLIQQRLDAKTALDAPRQGALQNPFVTTPEPTAPAQNTAGDETPAPAGSAPSSTDTASGQTASPDASSAPADGGGTTTTPTDTQPAAPPADTASPPAS